MDGESDIIQLNQGDANPEMNLKQHDEAESELIEKELENPDESTSSSAFIGNVTTQKEVMHVENIETANLSTPILSKRKNVFRTPQNRKRKMVNDNISSITAVIDKLDNVVQNNKNETDNEFDIFGKHIAVQLKEMPLYDDIMCQEQIQTIMRHKRLELLTRQS
ncbi:hypothetical protein FQR65_LT19683 [Abscondita terminalis]|nr:hypothetical protein FQR65_LT17622 [Abscondita terminalis]KAF5297774.1 hypothetical protein FQR65_LT19683 [Abscondita terminalis]